MTLKKTVVKRKASAKKPRVRSRSRQKEEDTTDRQRELLAMAKGPLEVAFDEWFGAYQAPFELKPLFWRCWQGGCRQASELKGVEQPTAAVVASTGSVVGLEDPQVPSGLPDPVDGRRKIYPSRDYWEARLLDGLADKLSKPLGGVAAILDPVTRRQYDAELERGKARAAAERLPTPAQMVEQLRDVAESPQLIRQYVVQLTNLDLDAVLQELSPFDGSLRDALLFERRRRAQEERVSSLDPVGKESPLFPWQHHSQLRDVTDPQHPYVLSFQEMAAHYHIKPEVLWQGANNISLEEWGTVRLQHACGYTTSLDRTLRKLRSSRKPPAGWRDPIPQPGDKPLAPDPSFGPWEEADAELEGKAPSRYAPWVYHMADHLGVAPEWVSDRGVTRGKWTELLEYVRARKRHPLQDQANSWSKEKVGSGAPCPEAKGCREVQVEKGSPFQGILSDAASIQAEEERLASSLRRNSDLDVKSQLADDWNYRAAIEKRHEEMKGEKPLGGTHPRRRRTKSVMILRTR